MLAVEGMGGPLGVGGGGVEWNKSNDKYKSWSSFTILVTPGRNSPIMLYGAICTVKLIKRYLSGGVSLGSLC